MCGHGDSTEESRQGGGGAGDGRDRPLVLRLPAQVGAHGLERSLDSPASQESGHDRMGRALRAGTGQGNGCSDAGRAGSGASCWSVFQGLALAVVPAHADRPAVGAVRVGGPLGIGDAPSLSRSSRVRCPAAGVRRPAVKETVLCFRQDHFVVLHIRRTGAAEESWVRASFYLGRCSWQKSIEAQARKTSQRSVASAKRWLSTD